MRSDRFEKGLGQAMERLNASIDFDQRLYAEDIRGSVAWARALESSGLITAAENANMVQGVIAHEVGHITGGHVVRLAEGAKAATGIMLLSLLLGDSLLGHGGHFIGARNVRGKP